MSRQEFWREKFSANWERDRRNITELLEYGWRVMIVWECALVGKYALPLNEITELVRAWLTGSEGHGELPGSLPAVVAYAPSGSQPEGGG